MSSGVAEEDLDRSAQLIRKRSELATAHNLVNDDDSLGAKNEPLNENTRLTEKGTGPEKRAVACPNQKKGCEWNGIPEDLEDHLNKFPGSEIPSEVEGCGFQTIECECKEKIVYNYKSAHKREHQNHQEVACEFEYAGCEFKCPRYLMTDHLEANMLQHITQLNTFTKRGKSKLEHLEASHVGLHAYCWILSLLVILLVVALVEYKIKLQNIEHDIQKGLTEKMIQIYNKAENMDRRLESHMTETRERMSELKKMYRSKNNQMQKSLAKLQEDIQQNVTKMRKKWKHVQTELDSHVRDFDREILKLQEFQHQTKPTLRDLVFDVKNLKSGFSKKYIDDTIRAMMCRLLPKSLSGC